MEFSNLLHSVPLCQREDCWSWKSHISGRYSVSSAYKLLTDRVAQPLVDPLLGENVELCRKVLHLTKLLPSLGNFCFNKIPTRVNLL